MIDRTFPRGYLFASGNLLFASGCSLDMSAALFLLATTGLLSPPVLHVGPYFATRPATPRNAIVVMQNQDKYPERDPEVDRLTGGGWTTILPRRGALVNVVGIGLLAAVAGDDTWLGRALNKPPIEKQQVEQQVDDAGTPFGPTEKDGATSGLVLLVVYNLFARVVRPRLAAAARERKEAEAEAEEAARKSEEGGEGPPPMPAQP